MKSEQALSVTSFQAAPPLPEGFLPTGGGKEVKLNFIMQPPVSCAFRSLFASPSRQSKPMNFVPDGIHRMFQLTQQSSREDSGLNNQA